MRQHCRWIGFSGDDGNMAAAGANIRRESRSVSRRIADNAFHLDQREISSSCLEYARHDSAVYETSCPGKCTNTESSVFSVGLNFASGCAGMAWWRLEFWLLGLGSVCWGTIALGI